ncbi:MAG: Exodeoxyribonuclease III [SAR116 cluster bacterium MED-G04]|jgi:exodeoxyribonuclease-3|nr:MAG: Exodeoxyribonuclease III [SAR116 cluster bacterium MED-G04]|tara:strand:+ start:130 stop:912 length:783 start_codon:yes stop_codon:yes gene_type:complete
MKIITWNINSVRLRLPLVLRLLEQEAPDVLCLQETKCPDDAFPGEAIREAGYPHQAIRGEKGYNGVAIIARQPLHDHRHLNWVGREDCRHQAVTLESGVDIHNFYIPAGGDVPDREANPKFDHKLRFLDELEAWSASQREAPAVLVGDLNIAPHEDDVWSHKQLLRIISHTPVETEGMAAIMQAGGWHDAVRDAIPHGKLYSWWSYRARDWDTADKGRRLDHIWVTPPLSKRVESASVLRQARGWEQPSDHAPVIAIIGD